MRLRESKMIIEYFFDEASTLRSVAMNFGVTQARVRQLLCKTMRTLRHQKSKESLIGYLDNDFKMLISKRDELEASLKDVYAKIEDCTKTHLMARYVDTDVRTLELSVRSSNALKEAGIKTVNDLCGYSEIDLLNQRNFGKKSLAEIKNILSSMGLSLRQVQEKS